MPPVKGGFPDGIEGSALNPPGARGSVAPSGGLLCKGHPIVVTGVGQLVEVVWQLQGVCGKRQVPDARVGLTHDGGGFGPGNEPGAMSITIVKS